jgi:hypothetical protein
MVLNNAIHMSSTSPSNSVEIGSVQTGTPTWTLGPQSVVTVSTRGYIGSNGQSSDGIEVLINEGRIVADQSASDVQIRPLQFINRGTVEASAGRVIIGNSRSAPSPLAWINEGSFIIGNGNLELQGAYATDGIGDIQRADPGWMDRVVDTLSDTVYITIDVDGLDPAIMPATGTPEPGGLSWYEVLGLLRRVAERKRVVGFDLVELSPMGGNVAPNFMCAKLIYKFLTYRFGPEVARSRS